MNKFGGTIMNETEKRRKQLLEETRRRYSESGIFPAVHPRYGSVYANLYANEDEEYRMSRSLGFRFIIAIMLFSVFIAMDEQKVQIADVDSKRIVTEIQKLPIEDWEFSIPGLEK